LLCHGRKELAEAAADQMRQLAFGCTYSGLAIAPAIQLAARLKGLASEELTATFFITRSGKSCPLAGGGTHPRWGIIKGDGVLLYPTSGREAATSTADLALPFAISEGQREEMVSILLQAIEDTTNAHW
jgi:adenosylmethionine-8-amino-7-oxononanoate aminotransferase